MAETSTLTSGCDFSGDASPSLVKAVAIVIDSCIELAAPPALPSRALLRRKTRCATTKSTVRAAATAARIMASSATGLRPTAVAVLSSCAPILSRGGAGDGEGDSAVDVLEGGAREGGSGADEGGGGKGGGGASTRGTTASVTATGATASTLTPRLAEIAVVGCAASAVAAASTAAAVAAAAAAACPLGAALVVGGWAFGITIMATTATLPGERRRVRKQSGSRQLSVRASDPRRLWRRALVKEAISPATVRPSSTTVEGVLTTA